MNTAGQNGNQNSKGIFERELLENPFSVPEGYFQKLEKQILLRKTVIDTAESSFLVPPNYQDSLTTAILSGVSETKLKAVLETEELTLPKGYFDDLQNRILDRTSRLDTVVPFQKRKPTHHWFSYVAAASIALAIGVFAILQGDNFGYKPVTSKNASIDNLPTQEIISYLAYYTEPEDLLYLSEQLPAVSTNFADDLSSDEIEAYLENSI